MGEVEEPWIKERLRDFDVETDGLRRVPGSSGVTVSVSVIDERSFYSYAGSNELLGGYLASHELIGQLQQASHVHFAVPLERRFAQAVLPALMSAGCTVSLDVGWQPEWYLKPENLQTCRDIDFFLPNRKEAEYLTGKERPEDVLLGLEKLGFTHAVVKLGADGAAIRTGGTMLLVPAPAVDVVDTTGAGDAFDARFNRVLRVVGCRPPGDVRAGCALRGFIGAESRSAHSTDFQRGRNWKAFMSNRKVSLIGGGGVRTPLVIFGVNESSERLGVSEMVLYDIDQQRASVMCELGRTLIAREGGKM